MIYISRIQIFHRSKDVFIHGKDYLPNISSRKKRKYFSREVKCQAIWIFLNVLSAFLCCFFCQGCRSGWSWSGSGSDRKEKPDPDPTPVKHSGFRIQTNNIRPQLFSVNTKVNIIDILLLNYVFDQKIFKDKFDNILTLEGYWI